MNRGLLKQKALLHHWFKEGLAEQVSAASLEELRAKISIECEVEADPKHAACLIVVFDHVHNGFLGGPDDGKGEYGHG